MSLASTPVPEQGPYIREESRHLARDAKVVGIVCLVLAVFLRCLRVSYREFFGEEFFTLAFVSGGRPALLPSIFYGHMPAYYELIRLWTTIAGSVSELMLRIPSVVFGLLACVAFFFFVHRYLRGIAFAICLLAFVLNPTLVSSSNDASPFALLSLFVVLSNYYCIRSLDEGGRRNWSLYGLFTLLGAITHPLFWFLMLAQFAFAFARPQKTPRPVVLATAAGSFLLIILLIAGAVMADHYVPRKLDVGAPSIADLARGLVAVVVGNFPRYGYTEHEFVRAFLYMFVVVCLALSVLYYRQRAEEARALPDNVVWIDETQDVIGTWNRLSLASFLMFLWVTFLVPAFSLMLLGSFAPDLRLHPEYFIIALPSLLVLIAAGVEAAPGRAGSIILGLILIFTTAAYDSRVLTDNGAGLKKAFVFINSRNYDASRDAVMYVTYPSISKAVKQYAGEIKGVEFPNKESQLDTVRRIEQTITGKDRFFVIYANDVRRVGNQLRSPVKDYFYNHKDKYETSDQLEISRDDNSYLYVYRRPEVRETDVKTVR